MTWYAPAESCEPCSVSVTAIGGKLVSITLESMAGGDSIVMERDVAMMIPYSASHRCDVNVSSHLLTFVPNDVGMPEDYDTELWVECEEVRAGEHEWLVHFRGAHARLTYYGMQSLSSAVLEIVKGAVE